MVMRWLMRGVCLVLLAGVVGVGVGSYAGSLAMGKRSAGRDWGVGAVQGLGVMELSDDVGFRTMPLVIYFERGVTAESLTLPPRTLGFYGGRWAGDPYSWLIIFPLWLPTVLLGVLNWFVWRWTRRGKMGRGFPVEAAKKGDG